MLLVLQYSLSSSIQYTNVYSYKPNIFHNFCIHSMGLSLINCMQTEYMQKWTKTLSKDMNYKKCLEKMLDKFA